MAKEIPVESASYDVQKETEAGKEHKVPNVIGRPEKIDAWIHNRQYDMFSPLYRNYADKKWLTIGDSGGDAFSFNKRGVKSIVASSLSDIRLQRLKASGVLGDIEIKALNAETTGEADDSHDVVVVKEAYHHFPRPAIAFYELLRVAKIAVAYNEPNCDYRFYLLKELKTLLKRIVRGHDRQTQLFEPAGNFIYKLSVTESVKMATALQLPVVAHKYCNSFFVWQLADRDRTDKLAFLITKLGIVAQWALSRLRLISSGRLILVLFKEMPDDKVLSDFKAEGFKITHIPRNPYMK